MVGLILHFATLGLFFNTAGSLAQFAAGAGAAFAILIAYVFLYCCLKDDEPEPTSV